MDQPAQSVYVFEKMERLRSNRCSDISGDDYRSIAACLCGGSDATGEKTQKKRPGSVAAGPFGIQAEGISG
jgi:hypothetical protein